MCLVKRSGVAKGPGRCEEDVELLWVSSGLALCWNNPTPFPLWTPSGLAATLCCGSGQLQIYSPNPEAE